MDLDNYFPTVDDTATWLEEKVSIKPTVAVVLSGGLDPFVDDIDDRVEISYKDIPNFPSPKAEGHAGKLIFGKYEGKDLVVMQGRFHYYEGHAPHVIVFPYFVLAKLGVKYLLTTNAVGGVNKNFKPGDVMMVTDHINSMGMNPLRGIAVQRKTEQFTSLTNAYDAELQKLSRTVSAKIGLEVKEGVYAATPGPSYETKAEVAALRDMGADAVGMSTVPSVIAANFLNMRVLTYSCIANPAADLHSGKMTHKEVLDAMNALAPKVVRLLQEVVKELK
ncbi:MAG: purine-nucleoside phosphorylase [Deltaproteobacteria bacterium]|jgi:purine-nucleoside phosphorylase|nr:purine-nucleoside phosphorylase [Deltaproteobacteria bacterium]